MDRGPARKSNVPPEPTDQHGGYDEFAWLYNAEWGTTSLGFLPALDRLVLDSLPTGSRILDLACGTGQLAALLVERGFRVTGLDNSSKMLEFARSNAPLATFVLADARTFVLSDRFDAVLSVYDSLNHIVSTEDLRRVFSRVRAALDSGGRFVFDLNTEAAYPSTWEGSFIGGDHVAVARSRYDSETRIARFEAVLFRPSDRLWKRTDVTLLQRCHAETDVRAALQAVGFVDVESVPAPALGARQPGRLFYAARAP